jgi:hypothetical protein
MGNILVGNEWLGNELDAGLPALESSQTCHKSQVRETDLRFHPVRGACMRLPRGTATMLVFSARSE